MKFMSSLAGMLGGGYIIGIALSQNSPMLGFLGAALFAIGLRIALGKEEVE